MNKTCKQCGVNFLIEDEDPEFLQKVSPTFGGKKYEIPPPTLCPNCRQQRRLAFCNESYLYPGECGMCKRKTLTEYPPHLKMPIYCRECWHSDKWNACEYGMDVDFSRSIFEQIDELKRTVPSLALNAQGTCINSDYIHYAGSCKNCYLIMHADFCEDCYYGYGFKKNLFCVDGFYNLHCELCYECVDVHKCYGLKYCKDCVNSNSGAFLRDCVGCKNCFLCVGLRNKEYYFENKKLTREEYDQKMREIDPGSYKTCQEFKEKFEELQLGHFYKEYQGHNLQDCQGNHLTNCKEAKYCFDCEDTETAKYCFQVVLGGKNLYDVYQYGSNLQESYECSISGENSYHLLFCDNCHMSSSDLIYCIYAEGCKNCFGCVNIMRNEHCVLNKRYSKEEYEELVPRIIEKMIEDGEWGEFFPMKNSYCGYNKSSAQLYYPMTKDEVESKGLKWDDYEPVIPDIEGTIEAKDLDDNIEDVDDDILNSAIKCEATGKLFKITPQEFKFYKRQRIPLPRRCPIQRHFDRFALRNPRKFWSRECAKCGKGIMTTYSVERDEKIYCEACYLQEVA